jgi:chromosome segregation ATPase
MLVYAALSFLRDYRKKNDVMDKLVEHIRENEERWGVHNTKWVESVAAQGKLTLDLESVAASTKNAHTRIDMHEHRALSMSETITSMADAHHELSKRVENMLGSQERLVARFSELKTETEKSLSDLATKWVAEVQDLQVKQTALFNQRPAHTPRFRP